MGPPLLVPPTMSVEDDAYKFAAAGRYLRKFRTASSPDGASGTIEAARRVERREDCDPSQS